MIKIIRAARWGNTIKEAASRLIIQQTQTEKHLAVLSKLIDKTLSADLPEIIPIQVDRLKELSAQSKDLLELMEALPRFGSDYQVWQYPTNGYCRY